MGVGSVLALGPLWRYWRRAGWPTKKMQSNRRIRRPEVFREIMGVPDNAVPLERL
jgi:hypothetical protein